MISEFKTFAMRGNVLDMAVGIIIGGAFGKIVSSFVNDVLMPPIGMLIGGVDFTGFKLTLKEAVEGAAAVTLNYGTFIQQVVDFLIVAFAIFLLIRGVNALQRKQAQAPAPPPAPPEDVVLLREIRDALRAR
jgi:large conductance mechanosensitive channel